MKRENIGPTINKYNIMVHIKFTCKFLCFAFFICNLYAQCNNSNNKKTINNEQYDDLGFAYYNRNSANINYYYPKNIGDSLMYIGQTHYTKMPDGFDTTYNDTIRIYKFYDSVFTYRVKEVKYKWFKPLPGQKLDDIMISKLRDSFNLNDKHIYELHVQESDQSGKIIIIFSSSDSMYFQDFAEDIKDKIKEKHTFRGKLLHE